MELLRARSPGGVKTGSVHLHSPRVAAPRALAAILAQPLISRVLRAFLNAFQVQIQCLSEQGQSPTRTYA